MNTNVRGAALRLAGMYAGIYAFGGGASAAEIDGAALLKCDPLEHGDTYRPSLV
jgi:hypothetical protein